MRKECENTRKSLRRYLSGHIFMPEQIKIERHLKKCALCMSELQALKRSAETKKLIKDITPPEGVVQRVKEGVFGLTMLKKIIYRPLWLAGIAAALWLIYHYAILPQQGQDGLETDAAGGAGMATSSSPTTALTTTIEKTAPAAESRKSEQVASVPPAPDVVPLVIVITVEDEHAAIKRINSVMQAHALLRKMRFSETVKEISGSMTAKEMLTFFNRIESVGKIRYSNSRLESFPSAQSIPFVMKLKAAPRVADKPAEKTTSLIEKPVSHAVSTQ